MSARVLVADADDFATEVLVAALRAAELEVERCDGTGALRAILAEREFDVVLADADALDLPRLADLRDGRLAPAWILMSAFGSIDDAVLAMRHGAFDFLSKPVSEEQVQVAVARALEQRSLVAENRRLKADLGQRAELGSILSRDPAMRRVFETVETIADTHATILIEGESGTGKSKLARAVHRHSTRAEKPFIVVNCGSVPETLLESELFGHVRGAFTGAVKDKIGKFEAAEGGTLFLDEIGCASLELQVKLLRVLQERVFERVGENVTRKADVRVVAATNQELREEVAAGRFREDLYWRVHVVALRLPPLRERPGDVVLLAEHFLARFAAEYGRDLRRLSPACLAALSAHAWPGNVRELEHCLERAVLLASETELHPADLFPARAASSAAGGPARGPLAATGGGGEMLPDDGRLRPLREALEGPEREILRRALERCNGSRKATAAALGINRTTLFNKMKKYGLMEFPGERG